MTVRSDFDRRDTSKRAGFRSRRTDGARFRISTMELTSLVACLTFCWRVSLFALVSRPPAVGVRFGWRIRQGRRHSAALGCNKEIAVRQFRRGAAVRGPTGRMGEEMNGCGSAAGRTGYR